MPKKYNFIKDFKKFKLHSITKKNTKKLANNPIEFNKLEGSNQPIEEYSFWNSIKEPATISTV